MTKHSKKTYISKKNKKKASKKPTKKKIYTKKNRKKSLQPPPFKVISYVSKFSNVDGKVNTFERKIEKDNKETHIWIKKNGKITTKKIKHRNKNNETTKQKSKNKQKKIHTIDVKNPIKLNKFMTLEEMGITDLQQMDFFDRYMYLPQIFRL